MSPPTRTGTPKPGFPDDLPTVASSAARGGAVTCGRRPRNWLLGAICTFPHGVLRTGVPSTRSIRFGYRKDFSWRLASSAALCSRRSFRPGHMLTILVPTLTVFTRLPRPLIPRLDGARWSPTGPTVRLLGYTTTVAAVNTQGLFPPTKKTTIISEIVHHYR